MDNRCSSKCGNLIPFINLIAIENERVRNNIVMQLEKFLTSIQNHDCVFDPIYDEEHRVWSVKCDKSHEKQDTDVTNSVQDLDIISNHSKDSDIEGKQQIHDNKVDPFGETRKNLELSNKALKQVDEIWNKFELSILNLSSKFSKENECNQKCIEVANDIINPAKKNEDNNSQKPLTPPSEDFKRVFITTPYAPNHPVDKLYSELKAKLIVTNENQKQDCVPTELRFENEKDFNLWYNASKSEYLHSVYKDMMCLDEIETVLNKTDTQVIMVPKYGNTWTVIANLEITTKNDLKMESWQDIIQTFKEKAEYPDNITGNSKLTDTNTTLVILVFIYLCTHPAHVEYSIDKMKFNSVIYEHLTFIFDENILAAHRKFEYTLEVTKNGFSTKIGFSIEFRPTAVKGVPFLKFYSSPSVYPWEYNCLTDYLELFKPLVLKVHFEESYQNIVLQSKKVWYRNQKG